MCTPYTVCTRRRTRSPLYQLNVLLAVAPCRPAHSLGLRIAVCRVSLLLITPCTFWSLLKLCPISLLLAFFNPSGHSLCPLSILLVIPYALCHPFWSLYKLSVTDVTYICPSPTSHTSGVCSPLTASTI